MSDVNIVGSNLSGDRRILCHMGLGGGLLQQTGALGNEMDQDQKTVV